MVFQKKKKDKNKNKNKKTKKKKRILPDILMKLFSVSSEITEKMIVSKHHSASVSYVKIMIKTVHVFIFCDRWSEKFQPM